MFACGSNGECSLGRVCRQVEFAQEGQRVCTWRGQKPLPDGGTTGADGGVQLADGRFIIEPDEYVPPDAGPVPDSGQVDAGQPDAGVDGGPADGGPLDGGPPDSGAPDAGPPDAGPGPCGNPTWTVGGGVWVTGYPKGFAGYNVIFATSRLFTGALGGVASADAICRNLAADAGLDDPGSYFAHLSVARADGGLRIPTADAGFIRPDGLPVAPSHTALLLGDLWYPPSVDEYGSLVSTSASSEERTWTGDQSIGLGRLSPVQGGDCDRWSDAGSKGFGGMVTASSVHWVDSNELASVTPCTLQRHLYCVKTSGNCPAPAPLPATNRRWAVLSKPVAGTAASAACLGMTSSLDAGFAPLLGWNSSSPLTAWAGSKPDGGSNAFPSEGPWFRPDGVLVAWYRSDLETNQLWAPIDMAWYPAGSGGVFAKLGKFDTGVWTGSTGVTYAPTQLDNMVCGNWNGGLLTQGAIGDARSRAQWFFILKVSCPASADRPAYCFEHGVGVP